MSLFGEIPVFLIRVFIMIPLAEHARTKRRDDDEPNFTFNPRSVDTHHVTPLTPLPIAFFHKEIHNSTSNKQCLPNTL